jgi:membrane protein YdbS with pleckstrin-like domain
MSQQSNDPSAGERVLREARMSWWALWPRVVLGLCGLVLAAWGLLRQDHAGYAVAGFGALMALWFIGGALARRSAMQVRLTDRYLVLRTGLVSRHTSTVMLNRVESLDVDQSLWQRMCGYGTLSIRGTGSEDLRLAGLTDPVGFQADARRAINAASGNGSF